MKIEEWFKGDLYYDEAGAMIFVEKEDGHCQLVLDVRGYGALCKEFHEEDAAAFQDEIGEFVVEAIKEKLIREKIKKGE